MLKNPPASAGDAGDMGLIEVGEILWEKERQPTPVLLPGESHRQRSLKGDGPEGRRELDMTEHTHTHT